MELSDIGSDASGSYDIRLLRVLAASGDGALVNDGVVSGDLTVGDIDAYVFDATAGEPLHIRVSAHGDKSLAPLVAVVPEPLHDAQNPEYLAMFFHETLTRFLQASRIVCGDGFSDGFSHYSSTRHGIENTLA